MLTTITPIVFEAGNWIRPRIELRIQVAEHNSEPRPLRIQWIRDTDIHGRTILRARWLADLSEPAPERERWACFTSR